MMELVSRGVKYLESYDPILQVGEPAKLKGVSTVKVSGELPEEDINPSVGL